MTKAEFLPGWKLLVLQPWGWRYNQLGRDGRPSGDALMQLDLYFSKVAWAHPEAWRKAVMLYVEGNEWPSIGELLGTLKTINPQFVRTIRDHSAADVCECPPEAAAQLSRILRRKAFMAVEDPVELPP